MEHGKSASPLSVVYAVGQNQLTSLINFLKKYSILLILLATYLSGSVGVFSSLYLEIHRNIFQATVSHALPEEIEKLVFSKKEFANLQWEEEFKEFEFDGKLFDVSEIKKTRDGFEVYCVNDSEEESIIALFRDWKNSNLPISKVKTQLHPLFTPASFVEISRLSMGEQIAFCDLTEYYNSELMQIPSPPPR